MLKRLLVGLVLGLVLGAVAAFVVLKVFGVVFPGAIVAYLAAAATGTLTGLIAGKPIWSTGARIEAGLKAAFGALLACGLMFALRRWVNVTVDLAALGAGAGPVAALPAVSLPAIGALLAAFFEIDNTPDDNAASSTSSAPTSGAKGGARPKTRVASPIDEDEIEEPVSGKKRRN